MPQPFPRSYPVKALLLSACFLSPFIAAEESTSAARDTVARYGVVVEAENPVSISLPFRILADHVAFYPAPFDRITLDGEAVQPQPGEFYGGWITSAVVGPFKGVPGSRFW